MRASISRRNGRARHSGWRSMIASVPRRRSTARSCCSRTRCRNWRILDPRQGQIVEFRYFAGMSEQEVAEVLSHFAVNRHARMADRSRLALSAHDEDAKATGPVTHDASWNRIKELFQAVIERAPVEREAFLEDACGDDRALQRRSRVAAHRSCRGRQLCRTAGHGRAR